MRHFALFFSFTAGGGLLSHGQYVKVKLQRQRDYEIDEWGAMEGGRISKSPSIATGTTIINNITFIKNLFISILFIPLVQLLTSFCYLEVDTRIIHLIKLKPPIIIHVFFFFFEKIIIHVLL